MNEPDVLGFLVQLLQNLQLKGNIIYINMKRKIISNRKLSSGIPKC